MGPPKKFSVVVWMLPTVVWVSVRYWMLSRAFVVCGLVTAMVNGDLMFSCTAEAIGALDDIIFRGKAKGNCG